MKTVSTELKVAIQQLADDPELCRAVVDAVPHACYLAGARLINAHMVRLIKMLADATTIQKIVAASEPKPRRRKQVKRAAPVQVNAAPNKCVGRKVCLALGNRYSNRCACTNCRAWRKHFVSHDASAEETAQGTRLLELAGIDCDG